MLDEAKTKARENGHRVGSSSHSTYRKHSGRGHRDEVPQRDGDRYERSRDRKDRRDVDSSRPRKDYVRDDRDSLRHRKDDRTSRDYYGDRDLVEKVSAKEEPLRKEYTVTKPPISEPSVSVETGESVTVVPMTEAEKNKIGAKILRAEIMGNAELVTQLKHQLEQGVSEGPPAEPKVRVVNVSEKIDEDKLTVKQLFLREKALKGDDDNRMFVNAAKHSYNEKNMDDEYDYERKIKKKKDSHVQCRGEQQDKTPITCSKCPSQLHRQNVIFRGTHVSLVIPRTEGLVRQHLYIISNDHTFNSLLAAEDDILAEIQEIKVALERMLETEKKSIVFMENYRKRITRSVHMIIECIPVESELMSEVKMYFKKEISECGSEWSTNKKLIDIDGRSVTRCLPKGLAYFWVTLGSGNTGYGHVIEDEERFPSYFGLEIVGGVIDAEPRKWLKPRNASRDDQFDEAVQLKSLWSTFNPFK
ncbi:CWF19-like protein 2 [Halotydeus destructor]|nr:CWF19-like protein 2 [Halotydeus destructor]